jgi:hypothetical protein
MKSKITKRGKWIIYYLPFLGCFIYFATIRTIENYQLKKKGICTNAYVFSKKNVGSKGDVSVKYHFKYNEEYYYGKSYHDDYVKIGDYITVVFLESDPQINRSNSFLKIKCSCSSEVVK